MPDSGSGTHDERGSEDRMWQRLRPPDHYYGDITRRFFIAAGIIILSGMPFFAEYLPSMLAVSALGTVLVAVIAGAVSPSSKWAQAVSLIVSTAGVLFFESYAAYAYSYLSFRGTGILFFVLTQVLALLFFFALYFSTKTMRWMISNGD